MYLAHTMFSITYECAVLPEPPESWRYQRGLSGQPAALLSSRPDFAPDSTSAKTKKCINLYLCFNFLGPWNTTTPQWACQLTAMRCCHKVDLFFTSCSSSCRCSSWLRFPCSRLSNDVTFFWSSTNKRSLSSTVTAAWWWSNKPTTGKEHLV